MSDTSVPQVTFGAKGFIAPPESAILTGVLADMNAAFGGDLDQSLETPQGQLASSQAACIGNSNDLFLQLTQQVDPSYADGRMQDAIARIYFLERNPAESTTVSATVTGLPGVVIPQGALALTIDGNLYAATIAITIPAGGSVVGVFACTITGPITCLAHSLNSIYKAVPGWDTIDNAADGAVGNDIESRENFEFRREQSVFLNSIGSPPSVRAAVLAVPGVLDAYVIDNSTAGPVTTGGVTLAANSLYVAAVGGDPQVVAQAIWSKKSSGCAYYAGNTTETVYDTSAGYSPPYPSYTVKFETAAPLRTYFAVSIADSANVPPDAASQIQTAILAAFVGADGGTRARIGATIYASRFYNAVAALGSWVNIISIFVDSSPAPTNPSLTVNINKMPTLALADIVVTAV